MAQKFIGLDEAANQLGISKDRLSQLREAGKLRGYRDGASWKFRADDIEKLSSTGLPSASSSDIALTRADSDDLDDLGSIKLSDSDASSGDAGSEKFANEKSVADESVLSEVDMSEAAAASDIGMEELDDATLPADQNENDDDTESILLSEAEFGDSLDRPPSTIIGKADLDPALSDLELVGDSDATSASDVKLASEVTSSEVLLESPEGSKSNFQGIEELEIDLEAESSRILSADVAGKAKEAAKDANKTNQGPSSDLQLEVSDSDVASGLSELSGIDLDVEESSVEAGLAGLSSLELEDDGDDDEDVLGDGSDITISSQDSGINIVAPSDSGLALDDVPLDLVGSAIGSSLDIGSGMEEDISLESMDVGSDTGGEDDFLLTPISESEGEEEESSSQVVALEEVDEAEEGAAALLGDEEGELLGGEFASGGLAAAGMGSVVPVTADESFSLGTVLGLTGCVLLMALTGMMMVDLVRNMWGWNESLSLNSSLIDSILSFF